MKRRLLIIAVCLLLGAVVNVAVAWGCAEWSWPSSPGTGTRVSPGNGWPRAVPAGWPRPVSWFIDTSFGTTWNQSVGYTPIPGVLYHQFLGQWGWPLRGLESEQNWSETNGLLGSMSMPKPIARENGPLLIRPAWPGFAINTIFYAALLWLLIPGPFALRRFLRVKRGLCPKCAYPMGESSVCTECGAELPKRARTT